MKGKTFDDFYQAHVREIFRYLFSLCHDYYLTEDLVNETFFRAFLFLEDLRGGKVRPWLFKVAYHTYVDFKRKNSRIVLKGDAYFDRLQDLGTPETALVKQELLRKIGKIVAGLPENQKQAILIYDFHGFSYKEAPEIMQVSIGHFKVLLFRAREKIRIQRED